MVEISYTLVKDGFIAKTPSVERIAKEGINDGLKEFYIIKDFKVSNPKNFGRGFGKDAFLEFLRKGIPVYLSPSFSDLDDGLAYAGREAMSMGNLRKGPENLLNKFYIPVLEKAGYKYVFENNILKIGVKNV